jgi:hypothetical protein
MHLEDQDSSVMAVHVDTSGFVGLGTTRPGSRLTVAGSASFGSGLAYTAIAAPTDGLVVQGNVGIGTFVPGGSLEIITAASTIPFMVSSTATADGDRLIVNSAGNVGIGTTSATVALLNVNGETYIAGPVGMGTFTPTGMLDVRQAEVRIWTGGGTDTNATSAGELYVQGDLEVDGTVYGDGSGLTSVGSLVGAGGWVDAGVNVFQATTTDLVGIGTTSPSTTLEIVQQSTNPALMISSVFNGDGNLMIVHSGGNVGIGTVQPIAKIVVENTGAIDSLRVNDITNDSSPFVIDQNGNVGIGTTSTAGLMTVIGNVGIGTTTPYRMITPPANGLVVEGATGIGTWAVPSGKLAVMGNVGIGTVGTAGALTVVSGNVGFGTWSPNSRLSVVGNIGVGTTTPYLTFSAPLNGMMVEGNVGIGTWNASSGKMIIMGGNVGIGTITPVGALTVMNGNVGIGTWSPTGKMVVLGGNVGIGTTALMATLDVAATGSLRIPYGYSPTVTEQGSVGIGTVNHQFYFNTAGTKRVVASSHTRCLMVENLASGDDNFPMGSFTDSVAIDGVWCTCSGTCTTKATFTLEDGSANAMTISGTNPTCQNIGTTPTSAAVSGANATLTAKESMRFDVTNTPSPNGSDDYEICVSYTITAVP